MCEHRPFEIVVRFVYFFESHFKNLGTEKISSSIRLVKGDDSLSFGIFAPSQNLGLKVISTYIMYVSQAYIPVQMLDDFLFTFRGTSDLPYLHWRLNSRGNASIFRRFDVTPV